MLGAGCRTRDFAAGEVIIQPGNTNRHLYRVRSGRVLVREACVDGTVRERTVSARQLFGEAACITLGRDDFTSATALEACSIDDVAAVFLLKLFEHRPNLAALFYRVQASKLAQRIAAGSENVPGDDTEDEETSEWPDVYDVDPTGASGRLATADMRAFSLQALRWPTRTKGAAALAAMATPRHLLRLARRVCCANVRWAITRQPVAPRQRFRDKRRST